MSDGRKRIIKGTVLAAGLMLLVAGIICDGWHDVWNRAVMICMECVGIG